MISKGNQPTRNIRIELKFELTLLCSHNMFLLVTQKCSTFNGSTTDFFHFAEMKFAIFNCITTTSQRRVVSVFCAYPLKKSLVGLIEINDDIKYGTYGNVKLQHTVYIN